MKKLFALFLTFVIMAAFAVPCFAADEVVKITTTAEKTQLKEGDKVTVTCGIKSPVGMGGFQFDVSFDNSRLKLVKATANKSSNDKGSLDIGHADDYVTLNKNGYIRIIYIYGGTGAMLKKDNLLVMEFEVLDKCKSGTAIINPRNITVGDKSAKEMTTSKNSAAIQITGTLTETSSSSNVSSDNSSSNISSSTTSSDVSSDAASSGTSSDATDSQPTSQPASSQPDSTSTPTASAPAVKTGGKGLAQLIIEGIDFEFKSDKTDYEITTDKTSLEITGIPVDEDASVIIEGADNLKDGKNKITITVTDSNGKTKQYNITANKNVNTMLPIIIIAAVAAAVIVAVAVVLIIIKKKRK